MIVIIMLLESRLFKGIMVPAVFGGANDLMLFKFV